VSGTEDSVTTVLGGTETATMVTTEKQRTATYWVDGRNGKMPWDWTGLILFAALPLFGLLALVATPLAVAHIQGQLVDEATEDLASAGIDPSGLDIDFDYRSGDASGVLPAGATAAQAEAAVDDALLRDFDVVAEPAEPAAPTTAPTTTPASDDAVEAATGPVEVEAGFDGSTVVLTGVVLDDAQRRSVIDAVETAMGPVTVDDRLEVSGLAAEVDGADQRIGSLVTAIATLGSAKTWQAELTDDDLRIRASADGDAAEDIDGLVDELDPFPTTVTIDEPDPVAETEVATLQSELDALIPEIAANVVFASGSDVLTETAQSTLDKVVAAMNRHPGPVVDVVGHTDDIGDRSANVALSRRRAAAVEAYLVDRGVEPDRLRSSGLGPDEPVDTNETGEGRATNRRVELTASENF